MVRTAQKTLEYKNYEQRKNILEYDDVISNQRKAVYIMRKEILENITNQFVILAKELVTNGNVKVIEEVQLPQNPVAPNKKMNIAIAFLLGLMVSVGIVFLLEYLDSTYKNKDQLERDLDIPVIGVIPDTNLKE